MYEFAVVDLVDCDDKAISVGEKSLVSLGSVKISNSEIGIASKDSALVHIREKAQFQNVSVYLSAYRKKQEFDAGTILYSKNVADCQVDTRNEAYIGRVLHVIALAELKRHCSVAPATN